MTQDEYGLLFEKEVVLQSKEIDPNFDEDWFSLSMGWSIAKGMTPAQAHEFSIWLRYTKMYYWKETV